MTGSIPASLSEFGNGMLFAMFIICDVFFFLYVVRKLRGFAAARYSWQGWTEFYNDENKAAIAWLTMSVGMTMKQWAAWWSLHLHTHGLKPNFPILTTTFLVGTFMGVWGLICLLRALSRYDWPVWIWGGLIVASVAFSGIFAL